MYINERLFCSVHRSRATSSCASSNDSADMRAAAWESALGQALRLFGGARGRAL